MSLLTVYEIMISRFEHLMTKTRLPLGMLVLLFLSALLLAAWSFAVPIFEAPDEPLHWQFVLYLHDNAQLPKYGPAFVEANHPPLYYLLISPLAFKSELPRLLLWYDSQGVLHRPPGIMFYEHADSDWSKYWPLRYVRLVTAFISVLTVLACYWIGLEATRSKMTGLLTAGLVAFLPQFTFRGMNISNDALVTLLCALSTYWIVRLVRRGFTGTAGVKTAVMVAFAFLSKINSIFLSIPFSLSILSERASWQVRFGRLAILAVTLILVAPWLIHNQLVYGDPFAEKALLTAVGYLIDIKPIASPYFTSRFPHDLYQSFIGVFGWMNLWMPAWLYLMYGFLGVASILGYVWRFKSHDIDGRLTFILLSMPLLSIALVIYMNLTVTQPQGRYLFPALPAVASLVAIGLEGIPGWSQRATWLILGALVLLNVYILATIVIASYWVTI